MNGIIFDLDGVICSTDEYHYQAWKAIADELSIPFDRRTNDRLRGISRMDSLEILLEQDQAGRHFSQEEKEQLAQRKNRIYQALLQKMSPDDLTDEVKETLEGLRAMGWKLAIGSSSKNAGMILRQLGLADFFDAVVDGNQIVRSKPDPEVFQKAAQALGLVPEACLVVEDAVAGTQAGHSGGFFVACVGDAARSGAGDRNMTSVGELLTLVKEMERRETDEENS